MQERRGGLDEIKRGKWCCHSRGGAQQAANYLPSGFEGLEAVQSRFQLVILEGWRGLECVGGQYINILTGSRNAMEYD